MQKSRAIYNFSLEDSTEGRHLNSGGWRSQRATGWVWIITEVVAEEGNEAWGELLALGGRVAKAALPSQALPLAFGASRSSPQWSLHQEPQTFMPAVLPPFFGLVLCSCCLCLRLLSRPGWVEWPESSGVKWRRELLLGKQDQIWQWWVYPCPIRRLDVAGKK